MPRQYEPIWEGIKKLPVGKELPIRIHTSSLARLKKAVLKEKSRETAARKRLGMRFAGDLEIRVETCDKDKTYSIIYFKLSWDGTRL